MSQATCEKCGYQGLRDGRRSCRSRKACARRQAGQTSLFAPAAPAVCATPASRLQAATPDLASYDAILLNSSAGKDSQAMIDVVTELARQAGVEHRIIVVHADLGRVEWEGTRELAARQAAHYGHRFEVVSRKGDLLDQIVERRESLDRMAAELDAAGDHEKAEAKRNTPAWPSSQARFCTSDQKTSQVAKLITRLVADGPPRLAGRKVRILNCLGIRAEESPERAKKTPFGPDSLSFSGKNLDGSRRAHSLREIDRWLPIFSWTTEQVWDRIRQSGVEHHKAYDLGMSRLSCVFCVFASRSDLAIAARHNPELGQAYVKVEIRIGHTFRQDMSIAEVVAAATTAA